MKRTTIVLLMKFIASVMSMLMYQTNVFPHEHLREMSEYGYKLIKALEAELK